MKCCVYDSWYISRLFLVCFFRWVYLACILDNIYYCIPPYLASNLLQLQVHRVPQNLPLLCQDTLDEIVVDKYLPTKWLLKDGFVSNYENEVLCVWLLIHISPVFSMIFQVCISGLNSWQHILLHSTLASFRFITVTSSQSSA